MGRARDRRFPAWSLVSVPKNYGTFYGDSGFVPLCMVRYGSHKFFCEDFAPNEHGFFGAWERSLRL